MTRLPLLWPTAAGSLPFPATVTDPAQMFLPLDEGGFLNLSTLQTARDSALLTLRRLEADGTPVETIATFAARLSETSSADRLSVEALAAFRAGGKPILVWQERRTVSGVEDGYGGTADRSTEVLVAQRQDATGQSVGRVELGFDLSRLSDARLRADGGLDLLMVRQAAGNPREGQVDLIRLDAGMQPVGAPVRLGDTASVPGGTAATETALYDLVRLVDGAVVLTVLQSTWNPDAGGYGAPTRLVDAVIEADGSLRRDFRDVASTVDPRGWFHADTVPLADGGYATAYRPSPSSPTLLQRFDSRGAPFGPPVELVGGTLLEGTDFLPLGHGHFLRLAMSFSEADGRDLLIVQEFSPLMEPVGSPQIVERFEGGTPRLVEVSLSAIAGVAVRVSVSDGHNVVWSGDYAVAGYTVLGDAANVLTLANAQRILARGGEDAIAGSSADDTLFGGTGGDSLAGNGGDDVLFGEAGADTLLGGDGRDQLNGGAGNNRLDGGAGADVLEGGDGADTLVGGDGDDIILGGRTEADLRDLIFAGAGDDTADGGHGNDEIHGGSGDDVLAGGWGTDTLIGNDGADTLGGGAFSDLLFGGAGADFLNGGFGFDRLNGGTGADVFFHQGVADHGSDWVQDYARASGDVLRTALSGGAADFQINRAVTPGAGEGSFAEAFVIHRASGQILWALVDGAVQPSFRVETATAVFDLI